MNVSDIRAAVVTVAGIRDEVVTVAGVAPAVQAVKDNLVDVQNAAENALDAKDAKDLALQYRNEAEAFSIALNPENMLHVNAPQALSPQQKAQAQINLDVGLLQGDRSKLINGGFTFASYGTQTIAPGGAAYVCDRWIVANNTNQTLVASHQAVPLNDTLIPGTNNGKMRVTFATAPTTGTVSILQRIENVRTLAGRNASARAYFTGPVGNENLAAYLTQVFGGGGSPSASVITNASLQNINKVYDAATKERKAQFAVPSISSKTIGTNGGDFLGLTWEFTPRQAGNYEIARASLVAGDAAYYEADPFFEKNAVQERPLILRYSEVIITYGRFFAGGGGQAFNVPHSWYPKRVVPSLQFMGLSSGANLTSYGWADVAADNGGRFEIVSAGGGDCFALGAYYRVYAEL